MLKKLLLILSSINVIIMSLFIGSIKNQIVALHYNINGYADMWGNKWFLLPISFIPLILSIVFYIYKIKNKSSKNKKQEDLIIPVIILFFIAVTWIVSLPSLNNDYVYKNNFLYYLVATLGALMVYINLFVSKLQQNNSLGIRTPWALKDKYVWEKTNKFGGIMGIVAGVSIIAFAFIGYFMDSLALCLVAIIVSVLLYVLVTFIYSYLVYKKTNK